MRNPEPAAYDDALRASETVDPRLVRHWGRLEYTPPRPTADALLVAFTAPHSIPVARDGDAAHKVEHHTWALARESRARGVAEHGAGGADGAAASPPFAAACVRWSRAERRRTRTRADPTNRDPNFLRDDEMLASPWLLALRDARARVAPPSAPALHVDVHGISDRDRETDACRPDVMAGTAAMARREAAAGAAAAPATRALPRAARGRAAARAARRAVGARLLGRRARRARARRARCTRAAAARARPRSRRLGGVAAIARAPRPGATRSRR